MTTLQWEDGRMAGAQRPEAVPQTEARLLVVDDEPNILELLATSLRFAGFEVTTATNGREALAAARSSRPDGGSTANDRTRVWPRPRRQGEGRKQHRRSGSSIFVIDSGSAPEHDGTSPQGFGAVLLASSELEF
jgi:hypothetical protein